MPDFLTRTPSSSAMTSDGHIPKVKCKVHSRATTRVSYSLIDGTWSAQEQPGSVTMRGIESFLDRVCGEDEAPLLHQAISFSSVEMARVKNLTSTMVLRYLGGLRRTNSQNGH